MATAKKTPTNNKTKQATTIKSSKPKNAAKGTAKKAGQANTEKGKPPVSDDNQATVTDRSLLFKGGQRNLLSPGQKKFNKQIKQLENLQKRINGKVIEMDEMLDFYAKQIYPIETKEMQMSIVYVKALFPFYKRKRKELSQAEHQLLGRLVKTEFEKIDAAIVDKDPELHVIWKKLYKQSYAESVAEDLDACKGEAIEQLYRMGVEFDLEEIEHINDFNTLNERIFQLIQEFLQQTGDEANSSFANGFDFEEEDAFGEDSAGDEKEAKRKSQNGRQQSFDFGEEFLFEEGPQRNKTSSQLKKELLAKEKEAIKQKSISSIYKQLAKIFHPDLERDEDKKVEKEALMQQLTQAYRQKDLHTLLRLELGWIHKEEDNIQQLTEDKLSIYNEILKEQIEELKIEERHIESHPKYEAMLSFGHYDVPSLPSLKNVLRQIKRRLKIINSQIEILSMNNAASIAMLKDAVRDFDLETTNADFSMESILSLLMAGANDFDWE